MQTQLKNDWVNGTGMVNFLFQNTDITLAFHIFYLVIDYLQAV